MSKMDDNLRAAGSATGDELWAALRFQSPAVFMQALSNLHLTEDMALFMARSRHATHEVLGALASDVRFRRSYKLILALVKNARTPQRIANSLLKHIKIFDLADLSRSHFVNSVTRQKVELMLTERIPAMPAGIRSALSRRVSQRLIVLIMQRSDRRVIDNCLESSRLTEDVLAEVLRKHATKPLLVRAIAEHPRWSLRYRVRYALIRNFHTPLALLEDILPAMKAQDLRDLYADSGVPDSVRPFIHSELLMRGASVETEKDKVYEVENDADKGLPGGDELETVEEEDDTDEPCEPDAPNEYELSEDDDLSPGDDWELECSRSETDENSGNKDKEGWERG